MPEGQFGDQYLSNLFGNAQQLPQGNSYINSLLGNNRQGGIGSLNQGAANIPTIPQIGANPVQQAGISIGGGQGNGFNLGEYLQGQNLSDVTGAIGTGIQAYSSLFGPGREIADQRLNLLRQQVGANQESLDNRRRFSQDFARASNNVNNVGG